MSQQVGQPTGDVNTRPATQGPDKVPLKGCEQCLKEIEMFIFGLTATLIVAFTILAVSLLELLDAKRLQNSRLLQ